MAVLLNHFFYLIGSFYLIEKKATLIKRLLNILFFIHTLYVNKIKLESMTNKLKIKDVGEFMLQYWFVRESNACGIHIG